MGLIHFFRFNGHTSRDYGIYISGGQTFNAPEKDVESIEIPGRSGNLTISRNRFKNLSVSYSAFIHRKFSENAAAARAWLLSADGYCRLEDTYSPEHFRMAQFVGPLDFDTRFLNYSGETALTFNCKPQRWRKDGQQAVSYQEPVNLYNSGFPALPLIKVTGTGPGVLYVGNYAVKILSMDEYVVLVSDTQNAYKGTLNKNSTISTDAFPVLQPGENPVSWNGSIQGVEITPRWWTV